MRIVPHARTIRKAREQVRVMVATGFSTRRIRIYLKKWAAWWGATSATWSYKELLHAFIKSSWDYCATALAAGLLRISILSGTSSMVESAVGVQ